MKKLIEFIKSIFKKKVETPAPTKPTEPSTPPVKPIEPPKPEPIKSLWYPKAVIPEKRMKGSGTYPLGYPQGAIVHFTAGWDKTEQQAIDTYEWGIDQGYVFFVIGPTGRVYQGFPLNVRGGHAGQSSWPGLGDGVSKYLVGIEVACSGLVNKSGTKYKSSFNATYEEHEVRYVTEEKYGCPTGYYKKFTENQEASLIELLTWLKNNNPEVFSYDYVLAHHEVAGKKGIGFWRKPDCGGSLSMPMEDLRRLLYDKERLR